VRAFIGDGAGPKYHGSKSFAAVLRDPDEWGAGCGDVDGAR
jgi:hypothetical protein